MAVLERQSQQALTPWHSKSSLGGLDMSLGGTTAGYWISFLSNVLERIVLSQLNEHLNHNNLLSPLQSAYRPNHSTETALLRIVNDLLTAMDNNKICILTLLHLSAAFDTIDHQILLKRLQHSFWHFWTCSILVFVLFL